MTLALVVEDHDKWQKFHKNCLESSLEKGNIDTVGNYEEAISMLSQDYGLYIIDGQFPKYPGSDLQLLGIQLAEAIGNKEGSYDKIIIVSSSNDTLSKARCLGITKVYNKSSLNTDKKEVLRFEDSIKNVLYRS